MSVSSHLRALPPTVPFVAPEAIERELGIRFRLRLGANESNFGTSPKAFEALHAEAVNMPMYGDPQNWELRQKISSVLSVSVNRILVGSGIDELLGTFLRVVCDPGDSVVTTLGSYATFEYGANAHGLKIERVPYRDYAPDLGRLLESAVATRAKVIYLANPDNPSGMLLHPGEIGDFVKYLPPECSLFLDEAYSDFLEEGSLIEGAKILPTVIRFRTFSKAYGLAGLRVGFAICTEELVREADKIRPHFGVNRIAQAAALASLDDSRFLNEVRQKTRINRTRLSALGASLGLDPLPSWTNFVTFGMSSRTAAESYLEGLLKSGVFIRKPSQPPLDRCIRITVPNDEQLCLLEEIWPRFAATF